MADNTAIKKLNKKIDGLSIDKKLADEIKAELKELTENIQSKSVENQLEQLNARLDLIENNNASLKDSIHNFVQSTSKTLETITKNDSDNVPDRLKEYLLEIVGKIDGLKNFVSTSNPEENSQFKNIKEELTFFQNEIETNLHKHLTAAGENVEKIVAEIKNRLEVFKEMLDNDSEKLIMEVLSDIKQLKANSAEISDNLKRIDERTEKISEDTLSTIIENSKSNNEKVINELSEIKKVTAKTEELENTGKESVEILKHELAVLKNNINGQIRDVLSKILVQDEIKFLCEEAISGIKSGNTEINVVRKHLKDIKLGDEKQAMLFAEMRNIIAELGNYGLSESSDKIDMIYDNMSILNTWASSSDAVSHGFEDLCQDFELTSNKVDIIYENLNFINEWVKTLDKFAKDIEELRNSCRGEIDLPQKVGEIYKNINAVREWSKKADALALQVKALSLQITETENSINSRNLNEIKRLFVEMNENISNMNTRNNKLIIESDKSDEILKEHLKDLKSLVHTFIKNSENWKMESLSKKIDEIKDFSTQNTSFGGVVTESFVYLAEWIDAAGAMLNSIKQDVSNLQETSKVQFEAIEELKNSSENPVLANILEEVQSLSEIINNQLQTEEETEEEIETETEDTSEDVSENVSEDDETPEEATAEPNQYEELKNLLEYVVVQLNDKVQNSEENKKIDMLSEKIENIEKKIESFETKFSSFEKYMSKLIDYLEED